MHNLFLTGVICYGKYPILALILPGRTAHSRNPHTISIVSTYRPMIVKVQYLLIARSGQAN